jgi:hypothetical protein
MKRVIAVLIGILGMASVASASPIIIALSDPNPAIAGFPPNYGGVVVDITSATTATFLFTANENLSHNAYLFGGQGVVGANINATSFVISPVLESNPLPGFNLSPPATFGGSNNEDGFGVFNLTIDNFDGFTHAARTVAFSVTRTDGGLWLNTGQVLTPNATGEVVAAHVFVCTSSFATCSAQGDSGIATGYAAGNLRPTPTQFCADGEVCDAAAVPEPGSMVLLGTGLLGLSVARRKFKR